MSEFMGGSGYNSADVVRKCDVEYSVGDDEFGYWNSAWGDPPVHTFPCGEPAVVVITVICEHGAEQIAICQHHRDGGQ